MKSGYKRGYCYGCDDRLKMGDGYVYRDIPHGITDDVNICKDCLLEHVERHYGDCHLSKAVRKYHDMEKPKDEQLSLL